MTNKYLFLLMGTVLLMTGCSNSTAEKKSQHTTQPATQKPLAQPAKSTSMMDHLSDAVKSATSTAKSVTSTVSKKAAQPLDEAKKSAATVVESVQEKATEVVDTAKNKLSTLGAQAHKEPVKEKTLYDRISDAVHHAEDTTQSIGTTAKVINTARHALEPILK